jgi:hypothetical protein
MTEHIEVRPLTPHVETATKMQLLTLQDLLAMGMSLAEARTIADPDDPYKINKQMDRLHGIEAYPRVRMGAFATSSLHEPDGFTVTAEWQEADEKGYMSILQRLTQDTNIKARAVYAFIADHTLPPDTGQAVRESLMREMVTRADQDQIELRGSFYEEDPSAKEYRENGFVIVPHRKGRPVGTVVQKLISRQPQ